MDVDRQTTFWLGQPGPEEEDGRQPGAGQSSNYGNSGEGEVTATQAAQIPRATTRPAPPRTCCSGTGKGRGVAPLTLHQEEMTAPLQRRGTLCRLPLFLSQGKEK